MTALMHSAIQTRYADLAHSEGLAPLEIQAAASAASDPQRPSSGLFER
ncbi:hypothetical protein [Diaphorobacter sp.]|nr:hypothetical protein [Diaphorobacter sp.]